MEYLLDTQVLLWIYSEPEKLSKKAKFILENPDNLFLASYASLWEIAIKVSIGKLPLKVDIETFTDSTTSNGISFLSINSEHLFNVAKLPLHHRDPFDRLIISQSLVENLPVITSDVIFKLYDIEVIW